MKKKSALLVLLLCFGFPSFAANVEVSGLAVEPGPSSFPVITGYATNTTSKPIKRLLIKFNLYNENGVLMGTTTADSSDLGKGETWRFNASTTSIFSSAKVAEIIMDK